MITRSIGKVLLAHCAYKLFKEHEGESINTQTKFAEELVKKLNEKLEPSGDVIHPKMIENYISRFKKEYKEGKEFTLLESNSKIPKSMCMYLGYKDFDDFKKNHEKSEDIDVDEELQGIFDIKNRNILKSRINSLINLKSHPYRILDLVGEYECITLDTKIKGKKEYYLQISRLRIDGERIKLYILSEGRTESYSLNYYIPSDNSSKIILYSFDKEFLFFAQAYIASRDSPKIIRFVYMSDSSLNDHSYSSVLILRRNTTQKSVVLYRDLDISKINKFEEKDRDFYKKTLQYLNSKLTIDVNINQNDSQTFEEKDILEFLPYRKDLYDLYSSYLSKWFMYVSRAGKELFLKNPKYKIREGGDLGFVHKIPMEIYQEDLTGFIKIKFETRYEEQIRFYEGTLLEEGQQNSLNFIVHREDDYSNFIAIFSFKISGTKGGSFSLSGGYIQTLREEITSGSSVLLIEKEATEEHTYELLNPDDYKQIKDESEFEKEDNFNYEEYKKKFYQNIKIISYLAPLSAPSFNSLSTNEIDMLPRQHKLAGYYLVYSYLNYGIALGKLEVTEFGYAIYETTKNEKLFGTLNEDYTGQNFIIPLGKIKDNNLNKNSMHAAFMIRVNGNYPDAEKIKQKKLIYTGIFTDNSSSQQMKQIGAGRLIIIPVEYEVFDNTKVQSNVANSEDIPDTIKKVLRGKMRNFIAYGSNTINDIHDLEILQKVEITNKHVNYLESTYHSIIYYLSKQPINIIKASQHAEKILKNGYLTADKIDEKLEEDGVDKEIRLQFLGALKVAESMVKREFNS